MLDKFEPQSLLKLVPLLALNMGLALAIAIPLTGVLVRYRANYSPKVVHLDGDDGAAQVRKGSAVNGYFSMLRRVYRLEGWAGLYKGTMPAVFIAFFSVLLTSIRLIFEVPEVSPGRYPLPRGGILPMFGYSVGSMLFALPCTILSARAITTPYKLPYFGLKQSLRTLLTPTERVRPWVLYLTPGLLVAAFLRTMVSTLAIIPVEFYLLPKLPKSKEDIDNIFILKTAIYFFAIVLSTSVVVPLEIITTRLAIQRNHASLESVTPQEGRRVALGEPPVYPGAVEEDVIGLRNEADPYHSFTDCVKRMVAEEGLRTMFRAWWITFIPFLAAGIVILVARQKSALGIVGF